jgi:hypothetical protein
LVQLLAIDRAKRRHGWNASEICERAGVAERAYFKWLRPWGCGGRKPTEQTIECLADVTSVDLGKLRFLPLSREEYERQLANLAARHERDKRRDPREHLHEQMRAISRLGVEARRRMDADARRRVAAAGARALAARMTAERRVARARAAAAARWQRESF